MLAKKIASVIFITTLKEKFSLVLFFLSKKEVNIMITKSKNLKKRIAILSILCMVISLMPASSFGLEPSDISGHWAKDNIQTWIGGGLINGYEDGTFRPDSNISRAEFMTLVNKAYNYSNEAVIGFSDVQVGDWYYSAVTKAKAAGYISGYPDNTMRPDSPISREEAASIMMKINNIEGNAVGIAKFSDTELFFWSKDAVGAVSIANIMNGYPDGTFKPQNLIKRGEAVVALDKALAYSTNNTTYRVAGTYGPASGVLDVAGNVIVAEKGTTLQNMVINGNLIVNKSVGDGNVYLDNVTVKGDTLVYGGGVNSVIIIDSTIGKVTISKVDGKIRIVVSGTTTVSQVFANSGVTLEESNLTGDSAGFGEINIDVSEDDTIVLIGTFTEVNIDSPSLEIQVPEGTIIDNLILDQATDITGTGTITNADINATGSTFETAPTNVDVAVGVSAPIIETPTPPVPPTTPTGGGGHSTVAVSGITITGDVVVASSSALTMSAVITPSNATNETLTWSLTNGTGGATISSGGELTVITEGAITVTAISQSDPSVEISKQIKVYKTIQAGINAAVSGDTVLVGAGTYQEFITLDSKSNITLESSEGAENTIIKSRQTTGAKPAVKIINSTGVAIDGFTITDVIRNTSGGIYADAGATSYLLSSILVTDSSDCTIQNNILFDFVFGVFIDGESKENTDNLVINNIINGNNVANKGIYIYSAMSPEVANSTTVTVSGNSISNTAYGVDIGSEADNIMIINNTLIGSDDVELPYAMTYTSPSSIWDNGRGISVRWQKHDLLIQGNTISNFQQGIKVANDGVNDAGDYTVLQNEISGNLDFGIQNLNSVGVIDASNNWWGNSSGPYNLTTNAIGTGDDVSDKVNYDPWYTDEAMTTTATAIITDADVNITQGSIVFQYSFDAGSSTLTYGNALVSPYYLNTTGSTVTLTNGASSSAIVSLSALGISNDGVVSYTSLAALQSQFANLNFVPTQVVLHLTGGVGSNVWTKEITIDLKNEEIALLGSS